MFGIENSIYVEESSLSLIAIFSNYRNFCSLLCFLALPKKKGINGDFFYARTQYIWLPFPAISPDFPDSVLILGISYNIFL